MNAMKNHIARWILLLPLLLPAAAADAASPLADAIKAGDRESALALVRAGVDVNQPQEDGTTALHWAVYQVDEDLAYELMSMIVPGGAQ